MAAAVGLGMFPTVGKLAVQVARLTLLLLPHRLRAPRYPPKTAAMFTPLHPALVAQPDPALAANAWPRDALLKRRRSVLFAFTFSPPALPV